MAIDFPASPTNGQTFTSGSVTYTWDGTKWTAVAAAGSSNSISQGNTNATVTDTGSDGRFVVTTEGSERARVDSSGRLLVGTSSSPTGFGQYAKVIVQGYTGSSAGEAILGLQRGKAAASITANEELGKILVNDSDGNQFASISCFADANAGTNDYPGRLVFSVTRDGSASPTEAMRITSKGYVGIGVTPSVPLQVFQATNDSGVPLAAFTKGYAGDSGHAALHLNKYDNDSSTNQVFQRFYINVGGTGSGMITANGASQATFSSFSDERLKENIQDLPSQLQAICSLRPVEFDYKDGSGHQIGFIAQEVQQVYPDLVGKSDNEMLMLSGMGKHEARLIKALQEAVERIETLEAKVAALESA